MVLEDKDCEFPDDDVDRMTKMLSGANLPPIEALMDGDLQEWRGGASYHIERRHCFILDTTLDKNLEQKYTQEKFGAKIYT